tara:strand:+ start:437293 stop:437667 length:375 start_codon:yes stop_codon:yes gene_type:complete
MDQEPQAPNPAPEAPEAPAPNPAPAPEEGAAGGGTALLALGVIVVVILAGAFFIFGDKYSGAPKTEADLEQQFDAAEGAAQAEVEAITAVEESTALSSIEADINESDLSELDAELDAIDQEFSI